MRWWPGRAAYGDLSQQLQAGSKGATGGIGSVAISGGGGGGPIELGAVGSISITGEVLAFGGFALSPGAGGGSGGGIFLHGSTVSLTGTLDAGGGFGGDGVSFGGFGHLAGGGGQVFIQAGRFDDQGGFISVAGGLGGLGYLSGGDGSDGADGRIAIIAANAVPEPSSIVLMGIAGVVGRGSSLLAGCKP